MTARTCATCGTVENEDDLRFCTSCGTALSAAPTAMITAPDWSQPPAQPPAPVEEVQPLPAPVPVPSVPVADAPVVQPYAAPVAPAAASEISINRRTASRVFLPPRLESEEEEQTPIISRAWIGQGARTSKKQLSGERKTAGDLPDWDPLPPGELVVVRGKKR